LSNKIKKFDFEDVDIVLISSLINRSILYPFSFKIYSILFKNRNY
jgi:hypothetical protein